MKKMGMLANQAEAYDVSPETLYQENDRPLENSGHLGTKKMGAVAGQAVHGIDNHSPETLYQEGNGYLNDRRLESFGHLLADYVLDGAELTIDSLDDKTLLVSEGIVSFKDQLWRSFASKFRVNAPNTTYYIGFLIEQGYTFGPTEPSERYMRLWTVRTNEQGQLSAMTDFRGPVGKVKYKAIYDGVYLNTAEVQAAIDNAIAATSGVTDVLDEAIEATRDVTVILGEANSILSRVDESLTAVNALSVQANDAVITANVAKTNATEALSTALSANETAANTIANTNEAKERSETATAGAIAAKTSAEAAALSANTAKDNAIKATTDANNAATAANSASANANTAAAAANTAKDSVVTAISNANNATTAANTATTNANTAASGANLAKDNAIAATTGAVNAAANANTAAEQARTDGGFARTQGDFVIGKLDGVDELVSYVSTDFLPSIANTLAEYDEIIRGIEAGGGGGGDGTYVHPATHPPSIIEQDANNRFMTDVERNKLAGIAAGANNYTHPATHPPSIIAQDANNRFMTDAEKTKLTGVATGANNYTHPATHPPSIIAQDASNRFMTDAEKTKLSGIATGANNYTHPATHPPSIIAQDVNNRFVSDTKIAAWDAKETTAGAQLKADQAKTAAMAYTDQRVGEGGGTGGAGGTGGKLERPVELACLYYGTPHGINGVQNVELAAQIYAKYDLVVWGEGYEEPTNSAYANTKAIAARVKELNPKTKIFGYIAIGMEGGESGSNYTPAQFKALVDKWKVVGATHIFLDEYGYDYYVTRERQNEFVSYCRSVGMGVCANAWELDHAFSDEDLVVRGTFRGNPNNVPAILNENDYYMFEDPLYLEKSNVQWVRDSARIMKMLDYTQKSRAEFGGKSYYEHYKTKGFALDCILQPDKRMFVEGYLATLSGKAHAYAASIHDWGAGDNNYTHYTPPNVLIQSRSDIGNTVVSSYAGLPNAKFTTKVGNSTLEILWAQAGGDQEFKAPAAGGLQHIVSLTATGDCITAVSIELTFGDELDKANVFYVPILAGDNAATVRQKIVNFAYSTAWKAKWTVREEGTKVIFTTKEPSTELGTQWWVYHSAGRFTTPVTGFVTVQKGVGISGGITIRQVSVDGQLFHCNSGESWRRPKIVDDGFMYLDTTINMPLWHKSGVWINASGVEK